MKHTAIGRAARGAALLLTAAGVITLAPQAYGAATATPSASPAAASQQAKSKAKLEEAQLNVCQKREAALVKRSTQMTDRATRVEAKFADIASKVEAYYTTKLVPDGKIVSEYAALKGDIDTKKAAVDTALSVSKVNLASFSCAGDDPKGALTSFRTSMQSVNTALKEYRTAIKNFTKALHQVVGSSSSATASPEAGE